MRTNTNTKTNSYHKKIMPLRGNAKSSKFKLQKLSIPEKSCITLIDYEDILYCEADSSYTVIHLQDNSRITTCKCLKSVQQAITSESFFRIHASYCVNLAHLSSINKDGAWYARIGDKNLPIARSRFQELKNYLDL